MRSVFIISCIYALIFLGCAGKKINESSPDGTFEVAKEYYDDEHYEVALKKLGEFVVRFPYSRHVPAAYILIAEAHYELGQYSEAISGYRRMQKLYPKHPKMGYILFRIGQAYWKEAPPEENRDQHNTKKAISAWTEFLKGFPKDQLAAEARQKMEEGGRRIAKSEMSVAKFYCKLKQWHACAHRYFSMAENSNSYPDLAREGYRRSAEALARVYEARKKGQLTGNRESLYTQRYTSSQLSAEILRRQNKSKEFSGKTQ